MTQDLLNSIEFSAEEVVSVLDPVNLFGFGERVIEFRNSDCRTEFIAGFMENQSRRAYTQEEIEVVRIHWNSHVHQRGDVGWRRARGTRHRKTAELMPERPVSARRWLLCV